MTTHNVPEVTYGRPFFALIFYNIIFALTLQFVSIDQIFSCGILILLAALLAHIDNKRNDTRYPLLYILYMISALINYILFFYGAELMANGSLTEIPARLFAFMINIGLIPGYIVIKIYQSIVNKRLHKKYWDDFEQNNTNI